MICVVVNNPRDWFFHSSHIRVISARDYLTKDEFIQDKNIKVFNLCRSYRYQSIGYYVSLLAAARQHRVMPTVATIQEMKTQSVVKVLTEDLERMIRSTLEKVPPADVQETRLSNGKIVPMFTMRIYFGHTVRKDYERLGQAIFSIFQAPLIKSVFVKPNGHWEVQSIVPISANEIPETEKMWVVEFADIYFETKNFYHKKRHSSPYDMAILVNPEEGSDAPSNTRALQKFEKAAESVGFNVEFITKDDYSKIAEFDALFIRETTRVNHHTFRFAQRAAAEGLVVIDDPLSIIRCSNKVYLAELMRRAKIPTPQTWVLHEDNTESLLKEVSFPCVMKQPDSSFSRGVVKVHDEEEFRREAERLLDMSDLIVVQEFLPTSFDWRVGVLNGEALYVCKYYMARKHWQIVNYSREGQDKYGRFETLPVELAPRKLISIALKAARLVGKGLYGLDIKQVGDQFYLIEINDNPNIDAGIEDKILRDRLYRHIMQYFAVEVNRRKNLLSS
ncbi:MAG: RimK family protein [Brevinematales bacterium]